MICSLNEGIGQGQFHVPLHHPEIFLRQFLTSRFEVRPEILHFQPVLGDADVGLCITLEIASL